MAHNMSLNSDCRGVPREKHKLSRGSRLANRWAVSTFFACLVTCYSVVDSTAQAAVLCPTLPPELGLVWTNRAGDDFDVCYASRVDGSEAIFGIFFGRFGGFNPEDVSVMSLGEVSGRAVAWYDGYPFQSDSEFFRQAQVTLGEDGYSAHVWINAETEEQLPGRWRLSVVMASVVCGLLLTHVVFNLLGWAN